MYYLIAVKLTSCMHIGTFERLNPTGWFNLFLITKTLCLFN